MSAPREVLVLDAGENELGRYPTLTAAHARQGELRITTTTACTRCAAENTDDPHYLCSACDEEVRS